MSRFIDRFVTLIISARYPFFGIALLLAAVAWYPARLVRFDRSIENMFAADDPLLAPYQRLKQYFGGNEVVMAVYRDPELLDPSGRGIKRLEDISRRMETVPGVEDVLSLAKVNSLLEQLEKGKRLGNVLELFRSSKVPQTPAILNPDSKLAAQYRDLFAGYTHSADGQTAAIVCMLRPSAKDTALNVPRAETITGLENVLRESQVSSGAAFLAGEPVMVERGFSILEQDAARLGIGTTVLLGLTILVFFHSLRWLVIPIAVVQWALIITRAILVISGLELSMVSSMLTAIVTVVGVATVMHLIVHVRELRTQGMAQREALQTAGVLLAGPILGAILTDMAGFGALCCSSVKPVRDFGGMMVLGSLLVIPATCLLVPALALVGARDSTAPKPGWGEMQIGHWLMRSIDAIHAHPWAVAGLGSGIAVISSLGVWRLEVETDFTRNFRQGSGVVRAYEYVETQLGGAGVWDVVVPAPAVLDADYVAKIRRLEERLRAIEIRNSVTRSSAAGLTKVLSVVDALDSVDAEPALAALTPTPELRYQALAAAMPSFMGALRSKPDKNGQSHLRIMLRARERQSAEQKQRLIEEVRRIACEEFSSDAEAAGFFVLLTNLIRSLLRDQWLTFAVASAGIMALVWLGFRSVKYAVIAMIPNAVPIYMVMGLLGWLGLKMNMGAVMIAAVSMGMSVDSSIHYFSAFRRIRREGKTVHAALVQCQQSVGLAMIFSTIALIIGFGVLVTSEFVPTIYFGALMSLAMLGGMLGNLIVLPLVLSWTEMD